jgi:hypothetical protein
MPLTPDSVTSRASAAPRRRRWKVWHWYLLVCLIAGAAYGFASEMGIALLKTPLTITLVAVAVVIFAMVTSVLWMREIDELARQAHYVAWFWGGSTGLAVLLFLMLAAPALAAYFDFTIIERVMAPFAGEGGAFFAGIMTSIVVLTLCYGAWWIFFWLRKR